MADQKYEEMYKQLRQEAENAMNSKSIESCVEDFKLAIEEKVQLIHNEIDLAITEALDVGLSALNKLEESSTIEEAEIPNFDELITFESRMKSLSEYIKGLQKKGNVSSKIVESLVGYDVNEFQLFKTNKEGKLEMKVLNRLKVLNTGKVGAELAWKKIQNKEGWSAIDTSDESILKVMGTGCYNYYMTDKEFDVGKGENVYAEFESNVRQSDTYFYFGVVNENMTDPNSNCMCCTISSGCYIYHNGAINVHGAHTTNTAFDYKNKGDTSLLKIRLMLSEREAYFQVNDNDEQGPFKLVGNKFRITFGSCNTANGTIKIVNSYLI